MVFYIKNFNQAVKITCSKGLNGFYLDRKYMDRRILLDISHKMPIILIKLHIWISRGCLVRQRRNKWLKVSIFLEPTNDKRV